MLYSLLIRPSKICSYAHSFSPIVSKMESIRDQEKMMIVMPSTESDGRSRCVMSIEAARTNMTSTLTVNRTRVYGIHDKLSSSCWSSTYETLLLCVLPVQLGGNIIKACVVRVMSSTYIDTVLLPVLPVQLGSNL